MTMNFTKMQGLGNDYIYIDCFKETVDNPGELSIKLSDRHFGIGADGIILISPSEIADCKMNIYNADGSEAEMCGNGVRCVGKFLYDNGFVKQPHATVETLAGVKILDLILTDGRCTGATVDMGEPVIDNRQIKNYDITSISMGNPHCVIFVDDVENLEIEKIGPEIECNPVFPDRTNVEFVRKAGPDHLRMRVWERGSGETMACGTGACATAVAGILKGLTARRVTVTLNGGDLIICWDEQTNHVFMTGPAEVSFTGKF